MPIEEGKVKDMISNVQELFAAKEKYLPSVALREKIDLQEGKFRKHVLICGGTGCTSSGSPKLRDALTAELEKQGLKHRRTPSERFPYKE